VTEEFALDKIIGNGGAVDGDEITLGAVRVFPNGASDELLARAALTGDHYGDVARGDLADDLKNILHHWRHADDTLAVVVCVDGGLVGARQAHVGVGLERVLGQREHLRRVEGLHDVIEGAELHRLDRGLRGPESGHQNHKLLGVRGANVLQGLESADAAHAHIEENQIRGRALFTSATPCSPLAASSTWYLREESTRPSE